MLAKIVGEVKGPFSAALGPDGDTLALGRNGIHLWSLRTGKRLGGGAVVPRREDSGKGDPSELRFSPGGGYLWAYQNRGGPYYALWNVEKRRLEIPPETLPESEMLELSAATLGPHDDFGAVAITDGEEPAVTLRTFPARGLVHGKRLPGNLSGRILAFSPDGTLAVIADQETDEEKTRLWSLTKGDWGREFYGPNQDAVFSTDGTLLVTSGTNQQGTTVALWRVKDGVQLLNLTIDAAIVGSPRISPDNRTLTLLDETGQVTAYDISRYIRLPDVPDADAENREFNATGDALFALARGVLHRWALPGLTETNLKIKPGTNDEFEELGMAVSPDGRTLATSVLNDSTPKLTLWDIETLRKLRDVTLKEESAEKRELRFSPDGRLLALSHSQPNDYTGQGGVEIVDVKRGKLVMRFTSVAGDHMSFSADGKTLVTADEGGVDVIDIVKKKLLPRSKGPGTLAKGVDGAGPQGRARGSPVRGQSSGLVERAYVEADWATAQAARERAEREVLPRRTVPGGQPRHSHHTVRRGGRLPVGGSAGRHRGRGSGGKFNATCRGLLHGQQCAARPWR
ncbi:WD40 repeat domain-containing protein [Microbispora rosea]|uniref:WD40 repeat domain-containing protein n=1 Tax=Microbispora rosea TaxID=58117 RepID=UPI00368276B7